MRAKRSPRRRRAGLRVEGDLRNEKINYKVREHSLAKVPVLLVVGRKEAAERTVSIRRLGSNTPRPSMGDEDEAIEALVDGGSCRPTLREERMEAEAETARALVRAEEFRIVREVPGEV